jgi:translocation and assembly module TamB
LDALNGRVEFDAGGLRLDDLRGRLGGGDVTFGGRVSFQGFKPGNYAITATGRNMRIRYPEGFRSLVDADLVLRGDVASPTLSGSVMVNNATWSGSFDVAGSGIFRVQGGEVARPVPQGPAEPAFPLNFDVRVEAPGTLKVQNRAVRLVSSADLTLRGTYDKPLLFGRVEVQRGEVLFEGNRYQVTRGTFDFANPNRIEPFFDIEAETRVRVPGETYRVVFHVTGTPEHMGAPELTSDPPLSQVDILTLLFGDPRDPSDPELRNLRAPGRAEQDLFAARAARLLASPVSSEVSRVVEQTFGVDTVQITPSLGDVWTQQLDRITPSARVTIGKRLSERVFLTYSQALSTSTQDQVILVEYNQSDRLSWIVSQNEDRTYAINVRVRHVF